MADFDLGAQARTLLAQQQHEALNLGQLFNQLQDLLGADVSLKVPLRDLFGREIFRKLLVAKQTSQKLAYKDALIQELQSVYSPALVSRLDAFLNGLIGSEAADSTSQLQPQAQPSAPLPAGLGLRGPVDEDVATVMASAPVSSGSGSSAAESSMAASASAQASPLSDAAKAPMPARLSRLIRDQSKPLLIGAGVVVFVLGLALVSSRRPCPAGMACSLASSFGLLKLDEASIRQRYQHIVAQRDKAEFLPDLQLRQREVEQLQSELKRGGYSQPLSDQMASLHSEIDQQIESEQGYYDQYKRDEAVVSSIAVVKSMAQAKQLEAAAKRLDAIPQTSLVRKAARYQAVIAFNKLRPFVAEAKTAQMQQLMQQRAKQVEAERAKVQNEIRRKEELARKQFAAYQRQQQERRPAAAPSRPKPRPQADSGDVF